MRKLFIPNDTSAVAMGSNLVANRFEELIKNKSTLLLWTFLTRKGNTKSPSI